MLRDTWHRHDSGCYHVRWRGSKGKTEGFVGTITHFQGHQRVLFLPPLLEYLLLRRLHLLSQHQYLLLRSSRPVKGLSRGGFDSCPRVTFTAPFLLHLVLGGLHSLSNLLHAL